jgi:hypothetical protein
MRYFEHPDYDPCVDYDPDELSPQYIGRLIQFHDCRDPDHPGCKSCEPERFQNDN